MHTKSTIQIKAAFLTLVFSLNILISMGCSLGLCNHCNDEVAEKTIKIKKSSCHHHKLVTKKPVKPKDCDRGCCNDNIVKLTKVDKSCPQYFSSASGKLFISFITSFYYIHTEYISAGYATSWRHFLNHHPPIPDIRIAIKSFQI